MDVIMGLIPVVIGAVVAGISAVVKAAYERRDRRLTAARQLELATKRTEFVASWLQISRTLDDDAAFLAEANAKARAELVEAYEEAQHALADGRSATARDSWSTLADQVRSVLLLERRRHWMSYVVTGSLWVCVLFVWLGVTEANGDDTDDVATWEYLLAAAFLTILLRLVAGALVSWLERRATSRLDPPTVGDGPTVSHRPATDPATSAGAAPVAGESSSASAWRPASATEPGL